MATKLFVGGLAWATTDDSLRDFFAQAGTVVSASVIVDRASGRSKGFGFVEMSTEEEAKKAMEELDGQMLDERAVAIKEARPQEPRSFGDRSGGGRPFNDRPRSGGFGGGSRGGFGGGSRGGSSNGGFRRGDR